MDKMAKEILTHLKYILISILLLISNPIFGQESNVSLISDKIDYNKLSGELIATGNVKVLYDNTILSADKIKYDSNLDKLSIIGKFVIYDGENTISSNNDIIINTKLKNGLIKGARAIINDKLQISAQSLNQENTNYNIFNTVVASSCEICANNPTPFWQIRARKIIHDKEKQKIFFKNARLDFFGLPVLYIPAFNIPEPGISRATGFLVPKFTSSNKLGTSIKMPYFLTLGKNKDFTITPFITSKNDFILENEYRQKTPNGYIELFNAISIKDRLNFGSLNGFVKGRGSFKFNKGYDLDFNINLANKIDFKKGEKPFINNYNYQKIENNQHKNTFNIHKTSSNSYLQLSSSYIQSFKYRDFNNDGINEEDPNIPVIFPELFYKKNYNDLITNGNSSMVTHFINLANLPSGKYSRLSQNFQWNKSWILDSGFKWKTSIELNTNTYLKENNIFIKAMPLAMLETRYPVKKKSNKKSHMIEPIIQIIKSPNYQLGNTFLNDISDSTTAEFEDTNLFSTNRFPGFDEMEAGLRANIGGRYTFYDPDRWKFTSTFGRVYREKDLNQFNTSVSTGLDKLNSDYVSSFIIESQKNFSLSSKLLFDDKLDIAKHESNLNFKNTRHNLNLGYVWLDKQSILNLDTQQHELNINAGYIINDYLEFNTNWRQNLNINSPITGGFDILYNNECAQINFSLDLEYDEYNNIDKFFGLQVYLSGLSANSTKSKIKNKCIG